MPSIAEISTTPVPAAAGWPSSESSSARRPVNHRGVAGS
jgi:hypothetical protein